MKKYCLETFFLPEDVSKFECFFFTLSERFVRLQMLFCLFVSVLSRNTALVILPPKSIFILLVRES